MAYKDEEILKAKREIEQAEKKIEANKNQESEAQESIYDEKVHIIGVETHFERRQIPELKVSIYMPENFFQLADDIKKLIYPAGNAPSHVFAGEDINFQMALSQTVHKVPDSGMKEFVDTSAQILQAIGPKVTIVEKIVEEKVDDNGDSFHIGMLAFVSKAVDMMVYNIQYFVSIDGHLLLGTINFPSKFKKRMIPMAKEIIRSIEIIKTEEE